MHTFGLKMTTSRQQHMFYKPFSPEMVFFLHHHTDPGELEEIIQVTDSTGYTHDQACWVRMWNGTLKISISTNNAKARVIFVVTPR